MKPLIKRVLYVFVICLAGCFKNAGTGLPVVSATAITQITGASALAAGNVISGGGGQVISRGVIWSTVAYPLDSLSTVVISGSGTGSFTASLSGLTANTKYYVRAFASNSVGIAYGSLDSFMTAAAGLPIVTTIVPNSVSDTSAISGGAVISSGGTTLTSMGVVWSTNPNPTVALSTKTSDNLISGGFTSNLTGLSPSTLYYVVAYATNSVGTTYGTIDTFTTQPLFSVGVSYGGGIIAYVLQPGDPGYVAGQHHGLIAAINDLSSNAVWWNAANNTTGASDTALGTGITNTAAIMNSQGPGVYAATICSSYTGGGYTDWYLPSKNELNKLYLNQTAIGGFSNTFYWSSSEYLSYYAWVQYFGNGYLDYINKNGSASVRPVRSF